jgi:site-specific recombinase XerD
MGYGPAMTADYRPSLVRSFERHLRAENRSEHTIASYLESLRQAEAFLAGRGRTLVDARREDLEAFLGVLAWPATHWDSRFSDDPSVQSAGAWSPSRIAAP